MTTWADFVNEGTPTIETETSRSDVTFPRKVFVQMCEEDFLVRRASPFHVAGLPDVEVRVAKVLKSV